MQARSEALGDRVLDARQDSTDFRDHIYQPALVQLPRRREPDPDLLHVRDQGKEGACTGFGLAAVIDYLNELRVREGVLDSPHEPVSTRMLYEMAKLHDRWPGEDYDGSSARGAMKGWHKNGVCPETDWPYVVGGAAPREELTAERAEGALRYPLGAYYRVLPRRSDFQAAIAEAHVLFTTARVHAGWSDPVGGVIEYVPEEELGGHAFAVLGYTERGLIVQNSWGDDWGGLRVGDRQVSGLAIWTYEDFEASLMDAWVARMALPVETLMALRPGAIVHVPGGPQRAEDAPPRHEIFHQYVHIDDGRYDARDTYPSNATQVDEIAERAATAEHLLLYAHGGLNTIAAAASRAGAWKPVFERNGIHAVHFIWETGLLAELRDVLLGKEDQARERVGG
ncbi:MAG: C1 family peptidase, partial [Acidobacteriota bacterium]